MMPKQSLELNLIDFVKKQVIEEINQDCEQYNKIG